MIPTWATHCSTREDHTATLLPSGKVLVAGGRSINETYAKVELYDPAAGIWSLTGSMQESRYAHTLTLLPSGKVLTSGTAFSVPQSSTRPESS